MQIEIVNFRGVSRAELDMSSICLVAGMNEAGKTSTAQAVAAAMTGEPMPIVGVKKSSAGLLVRSGSANGTITLTGPAGTTNIVYPSAKVKTDGVAPYASHFAVGIQSIVNSKEDERIKILTEYLGAKPTREDLDKSLAGVGLAAEAIDALWKLIEEQGWESVAANIKEKGAKLKGQWEHITGENYGSRIGENWIPEGYEPELMAQSEDTLKAVVTDARDALDAAIAENAVEDHKTDELQAEADLLEARKQAAADAKNILIDPTLVEQLEQANSAVEESSRNLEDLRQQLRDLPRPDNTAGTPCPSCGTVLEVQGKSLKVLETMSQEDRDTRQTAIDAMELQISKAITALADRKAAVSRIQLEIKTAENDKAHAIINAMRDLEVSESCAKKLSEIPEQAKQIDASKIERCRTVAQVANTRLEAFQKKSGADRAHTAIVQNAILAAKIAPDGIRGDVLAKALKKFNEIADPLCTAAGWRQVTLEADFMPCYGGTLYMLLSESAKWRTRVILQMVMAKLDNSQSLIIDAADILDRGGRNGLLKAVATVGLPTLICMTIDDRSLVPDLAKAGFGQSYWMGNGVAEAIS